MPPLQVLTLVIFLVGVLLVIIALFVWHEARRKPSYEPLEYVISDAIKHVSERLPEGFDMSAADVRRVLEYEIFYLQGLAQSDRWTPVETVAGGHEASIEYIAAEIEQKHGVTYSQHQIEEVLRLEADYLMAIGAVGDPVGEEE